MDRNAPLARLLGLGVCGPLTATALCAAAGLALGPPAALAVDAELEEIVVTAERRQERAQDAPVSVTAISETDLEKLGVRNASDITSSVPNMVMYSPYGEEAQPFYSLRGVTTNDWSQNQSSPIAMYVDEIYKPVGAVQSPQTFDLDRVEVLRGPQGTLYGKNATGGAVNFYSKNPDLRTPDGYVRAGLGDYSEYSARAAYGAPIIQNELGVRVAMFYEKRDDIPAARRTACTRSTSIRPVRGRRLRHRIKRAVRLVRKRLQVRDPQRHPQQQPVAAAGLAGLRARHGDVRDGAGLRLVVRKERRRRPGDDRHRRGDPYRRPEHVLLAHAVLLAGAAHRFARHGRR